MVRYILGLVLLSNILVFGQNDFKDIESKIIEIKESNIREEYKIILFKEILYKQKLPTPDLVKGLVFHRIGASFRALSKYDSAQHYTQQAILYKSKVLPKNDIEIIKSYYNLGLIEKDNYQYHSALNSLEKVYQLSINKKDKLVSSALNNISSIYARLGEYEVAIHKNNQALYFASNKIDSIESILNQGFIYETKNDYENAIKVYSKTTINGLSEVNQANLLNNIANYHYQKSDFERAEKLYKTLIKKYENIGEYELKLQALNNLYSTEIKRGQIETTLNKLKNLLNSQPILSKKIKEKSYDNIAKCFIALKKYDNAFESYLIALSYSNTFETKNQFDIYNDIIALSEKVYRTKTKKLFVIFDKFDSLIDQMRSEHTEQGSKLFWREKTHTFYENAIETCYRLKDYNKALYFMEKSRAILLLDGLKDLDAKKILSVDKQNQEQNLRYKIIGFQNKLENTSETDKNYTKIYQQLINTKEEYNSFIKSLEKTNSAYYQLKYNNQYISLSSLQAALKLSNQSFIEYFVGENTVYAFVATAKDARMIKINVQEYNSLSKQFLSLTAQKPPHTAVQLNSFCLVANKLYQLIYAPLNIPVGRVIISQDNYFLPFGALVADVQRQKFLVEDYAFSYSYSANILFREKEKSILFNKKLLGFSPIHYNKSLNLNTLSGSDQVLNNIEDKYFSGKVFSEKQATKQNFIQNAPNYKIIQLFTHGKADTVSDKSRIYFYDDALNLSELYQLEKLKAELVVLSACETNLGSNATGEGIMSFARGFAYLGVPSTVSTLWSVNNQSTYQLTENFYKYLDDGYEKDVALQMAQKDYLKNSGYVFPYYWSGVVLVGDTSKISKFFFSLLLYLLFVLILLCIFYFFKKKSTH